ncbi:MAG: sulfotransferase family protein [Planctomyces sp.]
MLHHPTPVFILGSGRSGTTITASLLSNLPGVQIAKETGYLARSLTQLKNISDPRALDLLVREVNLWLETEHWDNRASVRGFQEFCDRYGISGSTAFIHYVWQLDSNIPWHELSFIGDNTPLYVMAIPAIQELMPDARFIHMVRDPRDVICSILKMRFGADDAVAAAMEWHLYLGCWLLAERNIPADQRMECRYEDLCNAPGETMARLAGFLNFTKADADAALTQHAADGRKNAAVGFEKVATASHHTRLREPISPSRVGRFRSELTTAQIQAIEEIAQYGMLAYGYEPFEWHEHPLVRENRIPILKSMIRDVVNRALKRIRGR